TLYPLSYRRADGEWYRRPPIPERPASRELLGRDRARGGLGLPAQVAPSGEHGAQGKHREQPHEPAEDVGSAGPEPGDDGTGDDEGQPDRDLRAGIDRRERATPDGVRRASLDDRLLGDALRTLPEAHDAHGGEDADEDRRQPHEEAHRGDKDRAAGEDHGLDAAVHEPARDRADDRAEAPERDQRPIAEGADPEQGHERHVGDEADPLPELDRDPGERHRPQHPIARNEANTGREVRWLIARTRGARERSADGPHKTGRDQEGQGIHAEDGSGAEAGDEEPADQRADDDPDVAPDHQQPVRPAEILLVDEVRDGGGGGGQERRFGQRREE